MKVAMLTTVGERCGIAAYTRALVAGLRTLPEMEVEVVPITEGKQPTEHYLALAESLNAPDVDVVHIQHEHSFWGSILPRQSAYWEMRYLIQKPVVLTAHTTYSLAEMLKIGQERRPHKWLAKKLLLLNKKYRDSVEAAPFTTALTIVHTAAARAELIERGAKPEFVAVIPAGIPEPAPAPTEGRAFREKFGLGARRLVTVFGYIAYNKGYELTLSILSQLPEDVTFVIAGGVRAADMEPYRAQLMQAIAQSGQGERVLITGYLSEEEIAEAMAASDLALVPHTQATGSYSVTIPLAHGKPVLASDLDCFREIAARLPALELFRANDAKDYLAHLQALLADSARRERLSAEAKKYAQRYAWPKVAATTRNVYKRAIEVYTGGMHHPQVPVPPAV
jgi:glycosyltransferase involved in cell wall biosynthesis